MTTLLFAAGLVAGAPVAVRQPNAHVRRLSEKTPADCVVDIFSFTTYKPIEVPQCVPPDASIMEFNYATIVVNALSSEAGAKTCPPNQLDRFGKPVACSTDGPNKIYIKDVGYVGEPTPENIISMEITAPDNNYEYGDAGGVGDVGLQDQNQFFGDRGDDTRYFNLHLKPKTDVKFDFKFFMEETKEPVEIFFFDFVMLDFDQDRGDFKRGKTREAVKMFTADQPLAQIGVMDPAYNNKGGGVPEALEVTATDDSVYISSTKLGFIKPQCHGAEAPTAWNCASGKKFEDNPTCYVNSGPPPNDCESDTSCFDSDLYCDDGNPSEYASGICDLSTQMASRSAVFRMVGIPSKVSFAFSTPTGADYDGYSGEDYNSRNFIFYFTSKLLPDCPPPIDCKRCLGDEDPVCGSEVCQSCLSRPDYGFACGNICAVPTACEECVACWSADGADGAAGCTAEVLATCGKRTSCALYNTEIYKTECAAGVTFSTAGASCIESCADCKSLPQSSKCAPCYYCDQTPSVCFEECLTCSPYTEFSDCAAEKDAQCEEDCTPYKECGTFEKCGQPPMPPPFPPPFPPHKVLVDDAQRLDKSRLINNW